MAGLQKKVCPFPVDQQNKHEATCTTRSAPAGKVELHLDRYGWDARRSVNAGDRNGGVSTPVISVHFAYRSSLSSRSRRSFRSGIGGTSSGVKASGTEKSILDKP